MMGSLTIINDGFNYTIHYSYNNEKELIELFVPGKGFRFNKQNESLPEYILNYLIDELLWTDPMIQTFENMIYSDVWIQKGILKVTGIIV